MWKYDVSVIVAVYNCEKYIQECVDSILEQSYELDKIQILLIDDGSTDNSYEICKLYKQKYNNIELIKHTNHGVSYTRNQGIKKAEGKYIMILDSDDFIDKDTIQNLYNYMENNNDIDIASYTMKLYKEGKISEHYRNELYSCENIVYDIEKFPYLSQATINIIFRNEKENNLLYDEKMKLAEDEKFNTNLIMRKGKIGFCKEAVYYYRKHTESVTNVGQNPYYCFEQMISYFNYLINEYERDGRLPKYVQNLIIHAIKWRTKADIIFPYHLEEKEFDIAIEKIKKILSHIEIDTIMNKPNMDEYYKIYMLKLKGIELKPKIEKSEFTLNYNNQKLYSSNKIEIEFNRFKEKDGHIYMLGYIKTPICSFIKPELYLKINNKKRKLTLEESNFSYYESNIKISKFYKFECEVEINNLTEYCFEITVNSIEFNTEMVFKNWSALNKDIERLSIFVDSGKKILTYLEERNIFLIQETTSKKKRELKKHMNKIYYKKNPLILVSRMLAKTNKEIWLYCDRKGIFDNAYFQFKHDIEKKDNVKRYYVVDSNENDYKKYFSKNELRNNVIKKDSYIHKIMFLRSRRIITSFSSVNEYSPFKKGMLRWYEDILKYKLIYLQHGVLYANLLKMYSKEYTEIEKIVISSEFEKKNLIENYKYNENDLICAGMSRFDLEEIKTNKQNKILFAPSWRAYLIGNPPVNGKRALREKVFLDSDFYKKIRDFLNSPKLDEILEKNKIELHFKLHPIFEPYKKLFNIKSKNVKIINEDVKNEEYNLFITDLSSFQFDFTLLKTPMIYFVPDLKEFNAGLHTYRKLDLPLEEAFGDVVYSSQNLIDKIEYYLKNNFEVEEKYKKRMNDFFFKTEDCREKIYNAIK